MTDWETETCEECGHSGPKIYPDTSSTVTVFEPYNGVMMCASCRVDKRMADGDFK